MVYDTVSWEPAMCLDLNYRSEQDSHEPTFLILCPWRSYSVSPLSMICSNCPGAFGIESESILYTIYAVSLVSASWKCNIAGSELSAQSFLQNLKKSDWTLFSL